MDAFSHDILHDSSPDFSATNDVMMVICDRSADTVHPLPNTTVLHRHPPPNLGQQPQHNMP